MKTKIINNIIASSLILFLQAVVLKNVVLFDSAFCFLYVIIFLLVPHDLNHIIQLLIGFLIGLFLDVFYNTLGIHASASVLFIFAKIHWLKFMTPMGGYDQMTKIDVKSQGFEWFLSFSYPLILIHSLTILLVEAADFDLIWRTSIHAFYSSILTLVCIVIIQYLFFKRIKK